MCVGDKSYKTNAYINFDLFIILFLFSVFFPLRNVLQIFEEENAFSLKAPLVIIHKLWIIIHEKS